MDTTGVSVLAYASSMAFISSFVMSTALNTKSTPAATFSTSFTFITTSFLTASGMGVVIFQRSPTASSYVLPAERGLAATVTTWNHGWFSKRAMKRCPTIPVAPNIPTFSFFSINHSPHYPDFPALRNCHGTCRIKSMTVTLNRSLIESTVRRIFPYPIPNNGKNQDLFARKIHLCAPQGHSIFFVCNTAIGSGNQ